jgi:hypothetical protein
MSLPADGTEGSARAILLHAVRALVAEARSERSTLSMDSPERQFYLGVEAAADEVLQPQLAASREAGWLDRHPAAYRDGYLRTSTALASAAVAAEPPLRIALPDFPSAR